MDCQDRLTLNAYQIFISRHALLPIFSILVKFCNFIIGVIGTWFPFVAWQIWEGGWLPKERKGVRLTLRSLPLCDLWERIHERDMLLIDTFSSFRKLSVLLYFGFSKVGTGRRNTKFENDQRKRIKEKWTGNEPKCSPFGWRPTTPAIASVAQTAMPATTFRRVRNEWADSSSPRVEEGSSETFSAEESIDVYFVKQFANIK